MLLVAHKSDVEADREVTPEEIQTLAGEWNVPHVEVSCLNSVNVDKVCIPALGYINPALVDQYS